MYSCTLLHLSARTLYSRPRSASLYLQTRGSCTAVYSPRCSPRNAALTGYRVPFAFLRPAWQLYSLQSHKPQSTSKPVSCTMLHSYALHIFRSQACVHRHLAFVSCTVKCHKDISSVYMQIAMPVFPTILLPQPTNTTLHPPSSHGLVEWRSNSLSHLGCTSGHRGAQ